MRKGEKLALSEFNIIKKYLAPLAGPGAPAFSLSNDAAQYSPPPDKDLVFTKDTLVADVHFFSNDNPSLIAQKALRVNLSDLASMAAEPVGYLLSLALPKQNFDREKWVEKFAKGLKKDQDQYGWKLWGGDTVSTAGPITISVTAVGLVKKGLTICRSTAKPGDAIYVSGTLGDAAAGLEIIKQNFDKFEYKDLINSYYLPQPRLKIASELAKLVTSMMDISDGLLGDLHHICKSSSVGAEVFAKNIPISTALNNFLKTKKKYINLTLSGGDDYELLFTLPYENEDKIANISNENGILLTKIGNITSGKKIKLLGADGNEINAEIKGYRHF